MHYTNKGHLIRTQLVDNGTGTGIHSAVLRATDGTVVFDGRAHCVSKHEVIYTSGTLASLNGDRIQSIQNPSEVVLGREIALQPRSRLRSL